MQMGKKKSIKILSSCQRPSVGQCDRKELPGVPDPRGVCAFSRLIPLNPKKEWGQMGHWRESQQSRGSEGKRILFGSFSDSFSHKEQQLLVSIADGERRRKTLHPLGRSRIPQSYSQSLSHSVEDSFHWEKGRDSSIKVYYKYKIAWLPRRKVAETFKKFYPRSPGTRGLSGTEPREGKRVVETGKPVRMLMQ